MKGNSLSGCINNHNYIDSERITNQGKTLCKQMIPYKYDTE